MANVVSREYLIIGAGAMGSAAAYHLSKRGHAVTLLEQFELGHDRGSSHGAARIIRHSYADSRYAKLMIPAFEAWRALEVDCCQPLYIRTGGVSFCPPNVDYVARVAGCLSELGVAHRRLGGAEFSRLLPQFRTPADFDVVFEPDAGMMAASRALRVQQDLARSFGAEIRDNCPVLGIEIENDRAVVITEETRYKVDRLIVSSGSWTGRLRPKLDTFLTPTRQRILYYSPPDPVEWGIGRLPIFISMGAEPGDAYYGMPGLFGRAVKVGQHAGPAVDPDRVDRQVEQDYIDRVGQFVSSHLPRLSDSPIERTEVCLYTMTADEDFRLGFDPECPNIIVASPCSGHGFKFSCMIGGVLADLATSGSTSIDTSAWSLSK